jgi:molybdate transport system substrate-binding protein
VRASLEKRIFTVPKLTASILVLLATMTQARAEDLVLYGAGSLREAMAQIAASFGQAHGLTVATQFGPSGRMRERIEKGEHVDVFTSADTGHARKLVEDGRATVMAMFARNTVCVLSPATFGATTENVLDKLLAPSVKVGVSPAKVDPLGDYTVRLFEVAEKLRPGSGAALQARAVVLDTPPGSPPPKSGDTDADAILGGRVEAAIVYCSGRERYARILPDARLVAFPPELQVGPEYGLAVIKDARPEAMLLALTILSPVGQKILADRGFRSVTLPSE